MTNKKFIAWMAIFLLLGVGICAGWEFDNVKDFTPNDKYGTIEITNAFGLGDTLARYTLLENTDTCFINCKAVGTVTFYEESKLFSELNFEDHKFDLKQIEHKIFIEKSKVVYSNKDIFKESCNIETNGSETCEDVYVETQQLQRVVKYWAEYNYETLDAGVYKWKIEGKKGKGQVIDWIATTLGMELREWAVWDKATCENRNSFNILPEFTDTNQQLVLGLDYAINTSAIYVLLNSTNTEIAWAKNNNTAMTTEIWVNRSVTANTAFGVDVYYNCTDLSTPQYNCEDVFLGCNDLDNQTQATVWANDFYRAASSTTNEVTFIEGTGSNTLVDADLNWQRNIIPSILNVSYVWNVYDTGDTTAGKYYVVGANVHTAGTYFFFGSHVATSATNYAYGNSFGAMTDSGVSRISNQWVKARLFVNGSGDHAYMDSNFLGFSGDNVGKALAELGVQELYQASNLIDYFYVYSDRGEGDNPIITAMGVEEISSDVMENASIQPQTAFFYSELNCSVNYTGAVGSSYINFTWYKNNANVATYNNKVIVPTNSTIYNTVQPVNETLNVGDTWICGVFGTDGINTQLLNSTAITILNSVPTVPIQQYPLNNTVNTTSPTDFKCNGSEHGDIHPTYYEFWGNFTDDLVILQNSTSETFNFAFWQNGTFNWKCKSHDNISSSSFTNILKVILTTSKIINTEEGHKANTVSGDTEFYLFNVSFEPLSVDSVTAEFFYNSTSNTVKRWNFTSNKTLFNATQIIPNYNSAVTLNLTWLLTVNLVNGSTEYMSLNYTQIVNPVSISSCDVGNLSMVMNFTLRDEITTSLQNGTFEAHFIVWGTDQSINSSLEVTTLTNSSFYLCLDPVNVTRTVDAQIEYNGDGYDRRDYFFRSVTLNSSVAMNTTLETNLYLLNSSEAVATKFIVTDELENPLTDHYIFAQRKDISNASFFTVAMGKTDSVGEAYMPLDFFDAWYIFVVYDNANNLIKITDETILQATPVLIKVRPEPIADVLTNYDNMDLALSFNNDTKTFTLVYSDGSGAIREVCMDVNKLSAVSANVTVCSQCLATASGTINCGVGTDEGRFAAIVYAKQNPEKNLLVMYYDFVTELGDKLGVDGVVYALLMIMTFSFLFLYSPSSAIFASLVSIIFVFMLGFASLPYLAMISLVCAGVVVLAVIRS